MTLEFTTKIGCPVACLKYCPQEIITRNYQGPMLLDFTTFEMLLMTVPKTETVIFSGLSEPFSNPECTDMIYHAHKEGYKIWLFTTLVGLDRIRAKMLSEDIPFDRVCLHLPDAKQNSRIPVTTEYKDCLGFFLQNVNNLEFMNMGGLFQTYHSEDFIRGKIPPAKLGNIWCRFLESPQYNVLPNGDVYVCCMTSRFADGQRRIDRVIGNLHEDTYPELLAKFPAIKKELEWNQKSICHVCPASESWIKHKIVNTRL